MYSGVPYFCTQVVTRVGWRSEDSLIGVVADSRTLQPLHSPIRSLVAVALVQAIWNSQCVVTITRALPPLSAMIQSAWARPISFGSCWILSKTPRSLFGPG